jgi:hypothetical protein
MSEGLQLAALAMVSLALSVGWTWRQSTQAQAGAQEQWLTSTARFFYFVGLPYLAVITGILPPRFLGLKGFENLIAFNLSGDMTTFLINLQKAITLVLLEGLVDSGLAIKLALGALLLVLGVRLGLARLGLEPAGFTASVGTILYDGLHWAFYRAIFWLLTGDLYLGVVGGMAWTVLEWALAAWVQKSRLLPRPPFLIKAILLILTSSIFFYVPNLGLLWPIHWAMGVVITLKHGRNVPGYPPAI